ncbi:MAG: hydroxyneurosporene and rhodopin dehydrogenase CrtD [Pseudomonadota bacterium]
MAKSMLNPRHTPRVVVVGAGIGGLVSALVLAHRGLDVTLIESAASPGGKIRQVQVDGVGVDSGPTVFTMRWVLDQMLQEMGTSLADILKLENIGVLARHAWDGSPQTLDLLSDTERSADAIAAFSSPQEAKRFLGFCKQARSLYAARSFEHGGRSGNSRHGHTHGPGAFRQFVAQFGQTLSRPPLTTIVWPLCHLLRFFAVVRTGHFDAGGAS